MWRYWYPPSCTLSISSSSRSYNVSQSTWSIRILSICSLARHICSRISYTSHSGYVMLVRLTSMGHPITQYWHAVHDVRRSSIALLTTQYVVLSDSYLSAYFLQSCCLTSHASATLGDQSFHNRLSLLAWGFPHAAYWLYSSLALKIVTLVMWHRRNTPLFCRLPFTLLQAHHMPRLSCSRTSGQCVCISRCLLSSTRTVATEPFSQETSSSSPVAAGLRSGVGRRSIRYVASLEWRHPLPFSFSRLQLAYISRT
jgi:hypothetical protein